MTELEKIDSGLDGELRRGRPRPGRQFEDSLRGRLLWQEASRSRPDHLQAMIAAYFASGLLLLLIAALGAAGGGLFGS